MDIYSENNLLHNNIVQNHEDLRKVTMHCEKRIHQLTESLRDALFVNRELTTKQQEMEAEIASLKAQIDKILSQNSVWHVASLGKVKLRTQKITVNSFNSENFLKKESIDELKELDAENNIQKQMSIHELDLIKLQEAENDKLRDEKKLVVQQMEHQQRTIRELQQELDSKRAELDYILKNSEIGNIPGGVGTGNGINMSLEAEKKREEDRKKEMERQIEIETLRDMLQKLEKQKKTGGDAKFEKIKKQKDELESENSKLWFENGELRRRIVELQMKLNDS